MGWGGWVDGVGWMRLLLLVFLMHLSDPACMHVLYCSMYLCPKVTVRGDNAPGGLALGQGEVEVPTTRRQGGGGGVVVDGGVLVLLLVVVLLLLEGRAHGHAADHGFWVSVVGVVWVWVGCVRLGFQTLLKCPGGLIGWRQATAARYRNAKGSQTHIQRERRRQSKLIR